MASVEREKDFEWRWEGRREKGSEEWREYKTGTTVTQPRTWMSATSDETETEIEPIQVRTEKNLSDVMNKRLRCFGNVKEDGVDERFSEILYFSSVFHPELVFWRL